MITYVGRNQLKIIKPLKELKKKWTISLELFIKYECRNLCTEIILELFNLLLS